MFFNNILKKVPALFPLFLFITFLSFLIVPYFYLKDIPRDLVMTKYIVTDKYEIDNKNYLVINNKEVKVDDITYSTTKLGVENIKQERRYVGFNYYLDKTHTIFCYICLFIVIACIGSVLLFSGEL